MLEQNTNEAAKIYYYKKEDKVSRSPPKQKLSNVLLGDEFGTNVKEAVAKCYKEDFFDFNLKLPLENKLEYLNKNDTNLKVIKKFDKNCYSNKDIVLFKNNSVTMTNSVVYYLNNFYMKHHRFMFQSDCHSKPNISVKR